MLGGLCCKPRACRRKEKTMIFLVKVVIETKISGTRDSSVISAKTFISPDNCSSLKKDSIYTNSCPILTLPETIGLSLVSPKRGTIPTPVLLETATKLWCFTFKTHTCPTLGT